MLRNETKATELRAKRASKKALAQKAAKQATLAARNLPVAPSPRVTIEEQASCHFIANFVLMPKDGRTVGYLDYILPILREEGPDSHIQHAFNACSLAFLDNRRGVGSGCSDKALNEYTVALGKTNDALRDRASQHSDVTLAAVILLGMFEVGAAPRDETRRWSGRRTC